MKIIGALSWYDEPEQGLTRTVRSLAGVADELVAYDGAYAAFPGAQARPTSPDGQRQAIIRAARESGITAHVLTPAKAWEGGEVEKRARITEFAARLADGGWVFVIDGDETVLKTQNGWHARLAATDRVVAEVEFREGDSVVKARRFFRALPGLTVEALHYRYVTGDGRVLWGNLNEPQEPTEDLSARFSMLHLPLRTGERQERRRAYYRRRNAEKIEAPPCACGQPAIHYVAADLRDAGRDRIDAGWRPVCQACTPAAVAEVVAQGRRLRVDRDRLMMLARRRGDI